MEGLIGRVIVEQGPELGRENSRRRKQVLEGLGCCLLKRQRLQEEQIWVRGDLAGRGREQEFSFVNIHLKCLQDSQMEMGSGKLEPALEFETDV